MFQKLYSNKIAVIIFKTNYMFNVIEQRPDTLTVEDLKELRYLECVIKVLSTVFYRSMLDFLRPLPNVIFSVSKQSRVRNVSYWKTFLITLKMNVQVFKLVVI